MIFPFLDSYSDSFALDFVLFYFSLYYFPFPFRGHILFFSSIPYLFMAFHFIFSAICNTFYISFLYTTYVHTYIYQIMLCSHTWLQFVELSTFFLPLQSALTCWRANSHAFKNNTHSLSTHGAHSACTVVLHRGLRATLECGTPGANPCTAGDRGMCQRRSRVEANRVESRWLVSTRRAMPSICVLWPMCVTFPCDSQVKC